MGFLGGIGGAIGGLFGGGGGGGGGTPESYPYQYLKDTENMQYAQMMANSLAENPGLAEQFFAGGKMSKEGENLLRAMDVDPSRIKNKQDFANIVSKYKTQNLPTAKDYGVISGEIGDNNSAINSNIQSTYDPSSIDTAQAYQSPEMDGFSKYLTGGYDPYQFSQRDLSKVNDEAYAGVQKMQEEAAQRAYEKAGAQSQGRFADSGMGRNGVAQASNTSLGRMLAENFSNIGRQTGMDKANAQTEMEKFMANLGLQTQGAQAGENYKAAQFGEQSRQYGANIGEQARQYNNNFRANQSQFGAQQGEQQRQFNTQQKEQRAQFKSNTDTDIAKANKDYFLKRKQAQQDALSNQTNRALMPYNMQQQYFGNSRAYQPGQGGSSFGNFLSGAGKVIGALSPS